MSDNAVKIAFGIVLAVVVASRVFFRKRSLGTAGRIIVSVLIVSLLVVELVRQHAFDAKSLALVGLVIAALGGGIAYLRRLEGAPRK